jgi:hypothetical protein
MVVLYFFTKLEGPKRWKKTSERNFMKRKKMKGGLLILGYPVGSGSGSLEKGALSIENSQILKLS